MVPLRIGVVGCGYWGPNLVRTFLEIPEASVVAVADRDPARLEHVRSRHPQIEHFVEHHEQMFGLELHAMIVSTPPQTHFRIVRSCLEAGLDVFVEKPLATSTEEARCLADLADSTDRIMMVGHIGEYNPAVQALKQMVDSGDLGEIRYVDAIRAGLGLFHPSLNVIWDLAPHDVSILMYVLGESPQSVSTRGIACVQESIEDVAYMTLSFPSGILAHTRMSWLDPCKTRRITVVGSRKMAVYDDLEMHEKLKVYDKSVTAIRETDTFGDFQFAYNYGSVVSPYIDFAEPLRRECQHFVECLLERKRPLTDGRNGVEVVEVIEAAQRSLVEGGIQVPVGDASVPPRSEGVLTMQGQGPVGPHRNGVRVEIGDPERAVLVDLTGVSADEDGKQAVEA